MVNSVKCFAEVDHETSDIIICFKQIRYAVYHTN